MQVETFECQETAAEPIEIAEEAIGLIESLGLEGQKSLTSGSGVESKRCPYRLMHKDEEFAYRVLCPKEVKVAKYDAGPMPLRVLQVLAHAESLGMFSDIVVWDREQAVVKDPVLVGYEGAEYTWGRKRYILARWGEELEALPVLIAKAVQVQREKLVSQAKTALAKATGLAERIASVGDETIIEAGSAAEISCCVADGLKA